MQVLNKPMYNIFMEMVIQSNHSIQICSPFIKKEIVSDLYQNKKESVRISVVTNINLKSICKKSTDIEALTQIIEQRDPLYNFQRLHAKFYIFDKQRLVITSANLTPSGMKRNYEYGLLVSDTSIVEQACSDFESLCTDESSGRITSEHISKISDIIQSIPKPEEVKIPRLVLDYVDTEDVFEDDVLVISKKLTGWKKSLFDVLNDFEKSVFTTTDFKHFITVLGMKYPDNNNIDAKIRQQLQELRDLGLIKFVDRGIYKKLWK